MSDENQTDPGPATSKQAPTPAPAKATDEKLYAAYDTTYLKFVGGTHKTKGAASAAAKKAKVADFEIREV